MRMRQADLKRGDRRRLIGSAEQLDRSLYRMLTRPRAPLLDRLVATLSRTADRSQLWLALAVALGAWGGARSRRAAASGLLALGISTTLVNVPLKLFWGRRRPEVDAEARLLVRRPGSPSFPSGHAASALAFATAVGFERRALLLPLAALGAAVGLSRVRLRVHHPSDVLAGMVCGVASGALAVASQRAIRNELARRRGARLITPNRAVLVASPKAGRAGRGLARLRTALQKRGVELISELPVAQVSRLPELMAAEPSPPLVIAAGGDGTVGAVADRLADSETILAVVPLGTSNDFARSLGIPIDVEEAVDLLSVGKVSTVDLGRVQPRDAEPMHFVHAATAGLNVSFAKLATRPSLRRRLGRFTYAVAAALAVRQRTTFSCHLSFDGQHQRLDLTHLSVINAPVFGGALGMRVAGSSPDDRLLEVLALEKLPLYRELLAIAYLLLGVRGRLEGFHWFAVGELQVHTEEPLEVALDGEVRGRLPADFKVAGEALRVVTPLEFEDVDDPPPRS